MNCTKCGSELKEGAKFCGECGEKVSETKSFAEEVNESTNANSGDGKNAESGAETRTKTQNAFKKYIKPLVIFFIIIWVITAIVNHKSDEKLVYELIPEILEEFGCGLGYGEPEFPKFKSDDMIITDLKYTQNESGDTYNMFYVDGIVTVTTMLGTQVDFDYQMKVGLDEEFKKTGKWYAEIIDGDIFW